MSNNTAAILSFVCLSKPFYILGAINSGIHSWQQMPGMELGLQDL